MNTEPHITSPENAQKLLDWIKNRGGVAHWVSLEIGNPATWSSPATIKLADCNKEPGFAPTVICPHCFIEIRQENKPEGVPYNRHCTACSKDIADEDILVPYPSPNWRTAKVADRIIKDASEIVVVTDKEVARFHIGLTREGQPTAGARRKIARAIHSVEFDTDKKAWQSFDYSTGDAVILVEDKRVPLKEWTP